jgi:hypothetical protein
MARAPVKVKKNYFQNLTLGGFTFFAGHCIMVNMLE